MKGSSQLGHTIVQATPILLINGIHEITFFVVNGRLLYFAYRKQNKSCSFGLLYHMKWCQKNRMIIRSDFEIYLVKLLEVMIIFYWRSERKQTYIVCNFANLVVLRILVHPHQSQQLRHSPLLNFTEETTAAMTSTGKDFAISGAAACLAHLIHHPLYTLKSHMMYHGHNFSLRQFVRQVVSQPTFLYNGELIKLVIQ